MTHELKSHPTAFEARWKNIKPWEFRKNDRDFKAGDHLHEREYEPWKTTQTVQGTPGAYTGRHILSRVAFIIPGGQFGIPQDHCIMTVETIAKGMWLPRMEEP